jgi:hypothetical protein
MDPLAAPKYDPDTLPDPSDVCAACGHTLYYHCMSCALTLDSAECRIVLGDDPNADASWCPCEDFKA